MQPAQPIGFCSGAICYREEHGVRAARRISPSQPAFSPQRYAEWFGVAVGIFSGILQAPYIVRKLGGVGSGVWVLIFSLVDNFGMIELAFRSATPQIHGALPDDGRTSQSQ
jgi:hypothetical protein